MNDHRMLLTARYRLALGLSAATLLAAAPAAQDRHAEIYRNPAEFEKVSNAMQNLLIARFGPRLLVDEKGNPIPPASSGFTSASSSGSLSSLGNVLVNDPGADATAQDTQSETALVMGSGSRLVAAFNDSGSFLGANHFTGWAHSVNGGSSWTDPGVLPGSNDAGDPVLARDDLTGRIYLACLYFSGSGINLFRSDDDGVTWLPSVNAAPSSGSSMDKEWLAVDNFAGPGNGNVYLLVRDFGGGAGMYFFRSTDQGQTFGPFGGTLMASAGVNVQGAYVVVAPNHDIHAIWFDSNFSPAQIRKRTSSDQGLTWGAPVTVTTLTSTASNGNLSLVGGFRSNSFPCAAVNPVSGDIYVVYNNPTAASGGDRGNILLRQSTDGGATWNPAVVVNDDGTTRAQYFPTIAVRPDGTGLAVCWYDNRNHAGDVNIERWGVTASISGNTLTFGPNFRLSPQFVPVFGVDPVVNTVYMGDYDQMVADDTAYYTTWGDNRDTSTAVPSRKNANVRFTTFDQSGPGAIVGFSAMVLSGGNGNERIDLNECNDLLVELVNDGTLPASGLSATLSSLTPGVTIEDATQDYPDLAPGASGSGLAPFRVSTSPSFSCGTPVEFTLSLSYVGGSGMVDFSTVSSSEYALTVGAGTLVPGATDIGNHGDDVVTTIALPFPVTFYSGTYGSVALSSNGNAQFTSASNAYTNGCLPTATFGDVIALHWDDLRTDAAGDGIFTSVTGVAPSRVFHVDWRTHLYSGAGPARFELRLHEDSSAFEMVYGAISETGAGATIGCQRSGGAGFTSHSCNVGGAVTAGTQLSFELPGCPDGGGPCTNPLSPTVASVSPDHGPNSGVMALVITGTNFTSASSVSFGSAAAFFTVDSDTQISVDLGATAETGFVDVSVTNAFGMGELADGFDLFAPPTEFGTPCSTPKLTWSGAPILGEDYTVTTLNLGGASQLLRIDWSNLDGSGHRARRIPSVPCGTLFLADAVIDLGTSPSYTFSIPVDSALIGVRLRTQAQILAPAATTQVLDVQIGP
jgi:BNR repeat protein/IPT/TIG domain-containing protein